VNMADFADNPPPDLTDEPLAAVPEAAEPTVVDRPRTVPVRSQVVVDARRKERARGRM
jgi:hypothetical protein